MTLIPAYGRDYKTAKEATEAFNTGKDFLIADMSSPWDGKPANITDLKGHRITIRFDQLRKVTTINN